MKKINQYKFIAGVFAVSLLASCNYEEINTNPFELTDEEGVMDGVAVGGLITTIERTVFPVGTQADDTDIINQYQTDYHLSADCWSGFFGQNNTWGGGNSNVTYFLNDSWISGTYKRAYTNALDPWKKLKAAAEKNNTPEVFALAQILKISAWHKALECFGPMPYSHAADATMNIPFDSEKDIYTAIFKDLTEAIEILTEKAENGVEVMSEYDVVYAGNSTKWVKYANSLLLRLAMRVRYADEALSKQYVSQALNHSIGVMTAKDDEAQMSTGAGYTFRNNIYWLSEQYDESRMGSSMFSYLMGYEDPRLSAYFLPVDSKSTQGKEAFDGKQYQAVPAGHLYGKNDEYKMFSKPNIQAATPTYWLRASEVYFLRAEAALIWGGEFGNAEDLYKQGIEMSFQENGISSAVDAYNGGNVSFTVTLTGGSTLEEQEANEHKRYVAVGFDNSVTTNEPWIIEYNESSQQLTVVQGDFFATGLNFGSFIGSVAIIPMTSDANEATELVGTWSEDFNSITFDEGGLLGVGVYDDDSGQYMGFYSVYGNVVMTKQ